MPLFLGFGTVEKLLAETRRQVPESVRLRLFVQLVTLAESNGGMGTRTRFLLVQSDLNYAIGYVQIRAGQAVTVHGQVHPPDLADRLDRRADTLLECVRTYAERCHFRVIEASVARPRDYTYLDGTADFLAFDPESDTYRLKDSPPPETFAR